MIYKKIILLTILNICTSALGMKNTPDIAKKQSLVEFFQVPYNIITIEELKDQITSHIVKNKQWWYLDKRIPHVNDIVTAVCFNPEGTLFVTGTKFGQARVFASNTQEKILSFSYKAPIWTVALNNKKILTIGCLDYTYHHLNVTTEKVDSFDYDQTMCSIWFPNSYLTKAHKKCINSVSIDSTKQYLAIAKSRTAQIFDLKEELKIFSITFPKQVHSVYFSPCGNFLGIGSGNTAYIYNLVTNNTATSFTHTNEVDATCFDFSGKFFATGSTDCANIFARHDTWTLSQSLLKKVLLTWLLIEKPNKKINSINLLLADVAEKCELLEDELDTIWKTFPEPMQSALWRTMWEKIGCYGKFTWL